MEVKELKRLKDQLEMSIKVAVRDNVREFVQLTGVRVHGVNIDVLTLYEGREIIDSTVEVNVKIEL